MVMATYLAAHHMVMATYLAAHHMVMATYLAALNHNFNSNGEQDVIKSGNSIRKYKPSKKYIARNYLQRKDTSI